jgi:uncharacterized peroxidase-related enzyme
MGIAEQFLRGESELTEAEREIIFAYGSALNDCEFCHVSHKYTAAELGVDEAMWDAVLADLDTAPIDERMRAMLRYVHKLNRSPSAMGAADAAAVLAAGWSEEALFDAICVCGFNNLMNRVVDAVGIVGTDDEHRESGRRLSSLGYDGTMAKARERMRWAGSA